MPEEIVTQDVVTLEQTDVTPEVVELEEGVSDNTEPAPAEQDLEERKKRNDEFKERRIKAERELEERERAFKEQMDAMQRQNEELLAFKHKFDEEARERNLRAAAEQLGLTYEEVKAQVEKEEEIERKLAEKDELATKLTAKEQRELELSNELEGMKLYYSDKDALRSIDPEINIDELPDTFFQLRVNGIDIETALLAVKAKMAKTEPAPKIGKINGSEKTPTEYISEAEWDSMSKKEQDKLMSTDFEKVWRSQQTWLKQ